MLYQKKNILLKYININILWFIAIAMMAFGVLATIGEQRKSNTVDTVLVEEKITTALNSTTELSTQWLNGKDSTMIDQLWKEQLTLNQQHNLSVSLFLLENDTIKYWSENPIVVNLIPLFKKPSNSIIDVAYRKLLISTHYNPKLQRMAATVIILTDRRDPENGLFNFNHLRFYNNNNTHRNTTKIEFGYYKFWVSAHPSEYHLLPFFIIGWIGVMLALWLTVVHFKQNIKKESLIKQWILLLVILFSARIILLLIPIDTALSEGGLTPYFSGWKELLFSPFNLLITSIFIVAGSYYTYKVGHRFTKQRRQWSKTKARLITAAIIFIKCATLTYFHWALIENIYNENIRVELFRIFNLNVQGVMLYMSIALYLVSRLLQSNMNRSTDKASRFIRQTILSFLYFGVMIVILKNHLHGTWWILITYSLAFRLIGVAWRRVRAVTLFAFSAAVTAVYLTVLITWEHTQAKHKTATDYMELLVTNRNNVNFIEPASFSEYSYAYLGKDNFRVKSSNQIPLSDLIQYMEKGAEQRFVINNYTHLVRGVGNQTIIVSYQQTSWLDWLSTFCYLYLVLYILGQTMLSLMGVNVLSYQGSLSSLVAKLQLVVIYTIIFVMILVCIVSIQFAKQRSSFEQRQILNLRISTLTANIKLYDAEHPNQDDFLQEWYQSTGRFLNYKIALYSTKGLLLLDDTNDRMPRLMNSDAYSNFRQASTPYFLSSQHTEDKSKAVMFVNVTNRHHPAGYVAVLFDDLNSSKPIYSMIEGLLNIFVIILVFTLLTSIILNRMVTRSLDIIRNAIAKVGLMRKVPLNESEPLDIEIRLLVSQYNQMIDYLEESYAAVAKYERESAWQEMARRMAHEIKNPLTPMKLKVQMLQHMRSLQKENNGLVQNMDVKIDETLSLFNEQIDIIANIVDEFRDFARMRENNPSMINLRTVVGTVAAMYDKYENVDIVIDTHQDSPLWVYADGNQISRVIGNICKNGAEALKGKNNGLIVVSLSRLDGELGEIRITDNGPGIESSIAERVFEPNFTTKEHGSGLGLMICKQIVEDFGGSLRFETTLGVGTTFIITLPLKS